MSSNLNFSSTLNSHSNNYMNPQSFNQPSFSSQLQRNAIQDVIQPTINQNENGMNIENFTLNNSSSLNGINTKIINPQTIKQEFNGESSYLKISVYKQHQQTNQKTYIIQDDKIIGGNQINKNEIQIRRKKVSDENNLDLGITPIESDIDQVTCKISTEFGFKYSSRITPQILVLLSLKQFNSKFATMPLNIFKLIHQFIKEQPKFYIQDCGTSLKTLVRIQKDIPKIMNENNKYLIGADFYFHVVQLNTNTKLKNKKQQEIDTDYFYQTLVREHAKYRTRIHGLTKEEQNIFQQYLQNYSQQKKQGRKQYSLQNCNRPFLKIQFDTPIVKQTAVFIAKQEGSIFKIGRSSDCDIIINMNTVSRKQTQIKFNRNQWEICDGEGAKQSINGTWQSLQQYENPQNIIQQKISQPLQIEDKMEIKISENIFRFDMVGFGIQKRIKLNYQLYKDLTKIDLF